MGGSVFDGVYQSQQFSVGLTCLWYAGVADLLVVVTANEKVM